MDPAVFEATHLGDWRRPVVVYRCVGKYAEADLRNWLRSADASRMLGVLVGASSGHKAVRTTLSRAQALHREIHPDLLAGGVAIAERRDEHLRLVAKQRRGCA
ncbi:MAG TPA: 5,10-methylenetetrahydrofolate reductase, partial [Streptosporangiaceae bacterium]